MTDHKYSVGDRVQLARDPLNRNPGIYQIVALLPEEHEGWQYRVQDEKSQQQRVVLESRLEAIGER